MKRLLRVGLICSLLPFLCVAEDAGHNLSGQTLHNTLDQDLEKYDVNDSPYFGRDNKLESSQPPDSDAFILGAQPDSTPSGKGSFDTGYKIGRAHV